MAHVDILLPVRNGGTFFEASIRSIVSQHATDWRLLILDHGSTDGSDRIAARYADGDRRIELHRLPEATGLADLLNRGLDRSDAPFVLRQDADDLSLPDRIGRLLDGMERWPGTAVLGSSYRVIDGTDTVVGQVDLPCAAERLAATALFSNPIAHPTVLIDRAALDTAGARYGASFLSGTRGGLSIDGLAEDYLLFSQLAVSGKCRNLPDRLVRYRRHEGAVGATKFARQMELSLAISRQLFRHLAHATGLPWADPAPVCNHGGRLYHLQDCGDLEQHWRGLASLVRAALPCSAAVERELAFRRVLATRSSPRLLARYAAFRMRHRPDGDEATTVREWFAGPIRGRARFPVRWETT